MLRFRLAASFAPRLQPRRLGSNTMLQVGDGVARLDTSRAGRTGFPEIIFGEGKSSEQIAAIMMSMHRSKHTPIIASRVSQEQFFDVNAKLNTDIQPYTLKYHKDARIMHIQAPEPAAAAAKVSASPPPRPRKVAILSAGTSDYRVAAEAQVLLQLTLPPARAVTVQAINDVGVAGLHRLLAQLPSFEDADAVVVVAGMDGALPSVVGGLVRAPVIAVPTSVGYGAAFGGVSALLTMLNSCAPGVSVVNIDNGFGAAVMAHKIIAGLAAADAAAAAR